MWRTACGENVMTGAEAALLRALIDGMADSIQIAFEYEQSHHVGVFLFDNLQPTQQMAMLYRVAHALLLDDTPEPELSAVNEATVYAIFRQLYAWIEIEIDSAQFEDRAIKLEDDFGDFDVRAMTLAAYQYSMSKEEIEDFENAGCIPDVGCNNMSQWDFIVEGLADRILWDRDFEMESLVADQDPAKSEVLKSHMGIEEGYYAAIAPEISNNGFTQMKDSIRDLVRD